MDIDAFCNRCLASDRDDLLVTSCRHVNCVKCFADKKRSKCAFCQNPCKAIPFDDLPEELRVYFEPIDAATNKFVKIIKFQWGQGALWAEQKQTTLKNLQGVRGRIREARTRIEELRQRYRRALLRNGHLKEFYKKARANANRKGPSTSEVDVKRNRGVREPVRANPSQQRQRHRPANSSISYVSTKSGDFYTPGNPCPPRRVSALNNSSLNTTNFFDNSTISRSSSIKSMPGNNNNRSGSFGGGQIGRLLRMTSNGSQPQPQNLSQRSSTSWR